MVNLGMFGVKSAAPIIREPQACALALGVIENRIVPNDDAESEEIYKESVMMTATLSCDHRVVDGAVGAQWLSAFKNHVENPQGMIRGWVWVHSIYLLRLHTGFSSLLWLGFCERFLAIRHTSHRHKLSVSAQQATQARWCSLQLLVVENITMNMNMTPLRIIAICSCIFSFGWSFQPSISTHNQITQLNVAKQEGNNVSSRRDLFEVVAKSALVSSVLVGLPNPSFAAVATPAELKKLQLGHSRVRYLLTNWEKLTETCNNKAMSDTEAKQVVRTENGGGGFCDKNPLVVQEYL
eukprot:scaffold15938_cov78-Skeletonema_dohrnii-CCMP3373.AAC.1